jgi:hypothetical protein
MALTRDQIKAKRGVMPREPLSVPELGEDPIYISKLNAAGRDKFEQMVTGGRAGSVNLDNIRARFLTLVCVDEAGKLLFEESDAEWLGELDTDIVQKIVDKGFELNGINAEAVEEAAKN